MSRRMLRFDYLNGIHRKHRRRVLRKQQLAHREAQRAEQSLATLVEPLEDRLLLVGDLVITVEDVTTIHDETAGEQNTPAELDATTDENGNDIALSEVPAVLDTAGAIGAALSGYDGSNSGLDAFTVSETDGFTIDNLALTDANGDPLDGDDSGLDTVAGNNILLFSDAANDNIVFGVEDVTGDTVFAIYLDEAPDLFSGKFWTVQYEAIAHPDAGDGSGGSHDEPLDLTTTLFVTASRDLEFDLTNAPSGQNLFIMFGDGDISSDPGEVGIIATGKTPLDQSENPGTTITAGDTVNTSQGGGDTTFGINNQMIDEEEGIYFTFVTGPDPDFTVPNLDQNEADIEANIQFDDVLDAKAAEFQVVQLQSGKTAVVKVSAFSTTANQGVDFIDGSGLTGNTPVDILSVEVDDADGGGEIDIIDNGDGTFNIEGVEAGDFIRYFTDGDHNRVLIENDGDGTGQDSAAFDIGGFKLIQADTATADAGVTVHFEDDGPDIDLELVQGAVLQTDDGALAGGNAGGTATDSAGIGDLFNVTSSPGTDGDAGTTFALELGTTTTTNLVDVATGETVVLVDNGGVLEGRTQNSNQLVFSVSVDSNTGEVTQTQSRAVQHSTLDTAAPYNGDTTGLGVTDAVILTGTQTDGDGDTATDGLDISSTLQFTDDGPEIDLELAANALLQTDDGGLPGGNAGGVTTDSAGVGDLFNIVSQSAGADGDAGTSFALALGGTTTTTLLDSETDEAVVLSLTGGVVEGRTETSNLLVFTVSVDGITGEVALDQSRSVEQSTIDTAAPYNGDITGLGVTDAILLGAVLTDGDGDTSTDNIDISSALMFTDDGPEVDFGNLVGTVTTTPQIGEWSESAGADQPGTLSVSADGTFDMVTADGIASTGTVTFDPGTGTGTLTADFDNDADNGDETIGFSLNVNPDGTYVFTLDEVILPVVVLSTDEGQLPAGGPDPVQTLGFVDTNIVFFAVDADTAEAGGAFGPGDIIPAIELGEPDLTEAELEAGAAPPIGNNTYPFIRDDTLMNVSTSGIGVNNNVLQGEDLEGDDPGTINARDSGAFDESFVINPELLASEVKVFISKTAGGFLPPNADGSLQGTPAKTDYLYYTVYDELGNSIGPILVTSEIVFDEADEGAGGTGENLWSFNVEVDDLALPGDSIDAIQFTMGFGNIKIPKIEIVVEGETPPNDIFLDFNATLTDADGDTSTSDFDIDLVGFDVVEEPADFDYTLIDAGAGDDAFNADANVEVATRYLVQGFVPGSDQLYILNGSVSELNTGSDLGVGTSAFDSEIIVNGVTVIVEDATLTPGDITDGLTFLAEEEAAEDDGLVMLLV